MSSTKRDEGIRLEVNLMINNFIEVDKVVAENLLNKKIESKREALRRIYEQISKISLELWAED